MRVARRGVRVQVWIMVCMAPFKARRFVQRVQRSCVLLMAGVACPVQPARIENCTQEELLKSEIQEVCD